VKRWVLGVASGVVATLGGVLVVATPTRTDEGPANDRVLRAYLGALASGEYDAAYALVCTDETGIDKSTCHEGVIDGLDRGVAALALRCKGQRYAGQVTQVPDAQRLGEQHELDFDAGAFGEDAAKRPELVAIAQARAGAKYGTSFGPDNTVIVGDTVADVVAAREGGAAIVGVATGRDCAEELRNAGAQAVLSDLVDTSGTVAAIVGRLS
jgi:hypothetical protein